MTLKIPTVAQRVWQKQQVLQRKPRQHDRLLAALERNPDLTIPSDLRGKAEDRFLSEELEAAIAATDDIFTHAVLTRQRQRTIGAQAMRRKTAINPDIPTQILSVRHMPVSLCDRVRIEAARRKQTMEWVFIRAVQVGLPILEREGKEKKKA